MAATADFVQPTVRRPNGQPSRQQGGGCEANSREKGGLAAKEHDGQTSELCCSFGHIARSVHHGGRDWCACDLCHAAQLSTTSHQLECEKATGHGHQRSKCLAWCLE